VLQVNVPNGPYPAPFSTIYRGMGLIGTPSECYVTAAVAVLALQVNVPNGPYPAPFSTIYRGMGLIGTEGFSALPKHCGTLMLGFFIGGERVAITLTVENQQI
jgi:hypothetical protein